MMDLLTNIGAIFKDQMRRAARRQMASALMGGLALLFLGVALISGIAALGVLIAARWGVLVACLSIGAAALLVAVLLVVIAAQQAKQSRRRQQAELAQLRQSVMAAKVVAAELTRNKAMMVATIFGILLGLKATSRDPRDDP